MLLKSMIGKSTAVGFLCMTTPACVAMKNMPGDYSPAQSRARRRLIQKIARRRRLTVKDAAEDAEVHITRVLKSMDIDPYDLKKVRESPSFLVRPQKGQRISYDLKDKKVVEPLLRFPTDIPFGKDEDGKIEVVRPLLRVDPNIPLASSRASPKKKRASPKKKNVLPPPAFPPSPMKKPKVPPQSPKKNKVPPPLANRRIGKGQLIFLVNRTALARKDEPEKFVYLEEVWINKGEKGDEDWELYVPGLAGFHSGPSIEEVRAAEDRKKLFEPFQYEGKTYKLVSKPILEQLDLNLHTYGVEQVGKGGYGTAWKVRTANGTGTLQVVKKMEKGKLDSDDRKSLTNEIKFLEILKGHDNISEIYNVCEDKEYLYIVMEHLAGDFIEYLYSNTEKMSLEDKTLLKGIMTEMWPDKTIPMEKKVQAECRRRIIEARIKLAEDRDRVRIPLLKQLYTGIQHMHDNKIAHLDIKPENLMFADDGNTKVKVIDLGLSRTFQWGQMMENLQGTVEYVAPEMLRKRPSYDESVDVWALGCTTFQMVYEDLPFDAGEGNDNATFDLIRQGFNVKSFKRNRMERCSGPCRELIALMLHEDPAKRLTMDEVLEHPYIDEAKPWNKDGDFDINSDAALIKSLLLLSNDRLNRCWSEIDIDEKKWILGKNFDDTYLDEIDEEEQHVIDYLGGDAITPNEQFMLHNNQINKLKSTFEGVDEDILTKTLTNVVKQVENINIDNIVKALFNTSDGSINMTKLREARTVWKIASKYSRVKKLENILGRRFHAFKIEIEKIQGLIHRKWQDIKHAHVGRYKTSAELSQDEEKIDPTDTGSVES